MPPLTESGRVMRGKRALLAMLEVGGYLDTEAAHEKTWRMAAYQVRRMIGARFSTTRVSPEILRFWRTH